MDTTRIHEARTREEELLANLVERYRHELIDDEVRQELRERILCLRRGLGL